MSDKLGRKVHHFDASVKVRTPDGVATIKATLPDYHSPAEFAKLAKSALQSAGHPVETVGEICEALKAAPHHVQDALAAAGATNVNIHFADMSPEAAGVDLDAGDQIA